MEARVLVLYDLVEGHELLGQHLLVDFHCYDDVVSRAVWGVMSSPRNKGG
jgi:hypothetical protein